MKLVNKVIIIASVLMLILCASAFAADMHNSVKIAFDGGEIPTIKEQSVTFGIFDESGQQLLDSKTQSMKRGKRWFDIEFALPEYKIGTKFVVKVTEGEGTITFCDVTAASHTIETYSMPDENGQLVCQTTFYMTFNSPWNKEATIKIPTSKETLFYHFVMDDDVYVTNDLLGKLDIECKTDFDAEKPSFTLYTGDRKATFYVDDIYAVFAGKGENLTGKAFVVDGMPFVPLSRVAEYFDCNYKLVKSDEYTREITLSVSSYSEKVKKAAYVNSRDITSRTNYLVWVDKSEYTVNVYLGSNKKWSHVASFPCSIGAPSTPTIEGSFEYYQYQDRWQYPGYYCGPIMRFKGGYALHSVLINNDGTFRDGRVGKQISHGCVRMLPDDIKWMVNNIPLHTRILVTA